MKHTQQVSEQVLAVAHRIHALREIRGLSSVEMAALCGENHADYLALETGKADFQFTFIYKCAQVLGVEITELLSGNEAKLSSYTVTRSGKGKATVVEQNVEIRNLAPYFRKKLAEPHFVRYTPSPEHEIALASHSGQEFDYIISGNLKVQIGDNVEMLSPGDSIYYDSAIPHGMVAVGEQDCVFCAVVIAGEDGQDEHMAEPIKAAKMPDNLIFENFVLPKEDKDGALLSVSYKNEDNFNFAFDIVDELAKRKPDKLAMLHISNDMKESRISFAEMSRRSNRAANYFKSLGIKKGDRVMLVLKRHVEFWYSMLALHKLGAVAIPATDQLLEHDFEYRFTAAGVTAIVCTSDGQAAHFAELAAKKCPEVKHFVLVGDSRDGWHSYHEQVSLFSDKFKLSGDRPCGTDDMLMFFTSGTTGYPKMAAHNFKYPLGHFVTAKYWHRVNPEGIHFTISDTGWAKAVWGKIYGQWLCEAAIFTYDFDRFDAGKILPMFKQHGITTFCAPPTMYRFMVKQDLSGYDLSTIEHATTAGEALNPEVFHRFKEATGLSVMEGFGQTEGTLMIANLVGMTPKIGAMGKPSPIYDVDIVDSEGKSVADGEVGEIVIRATPENAPCGLFKGYYRNEERTKEAWHDGLYHTGDTAWRDEDGYYWYVGRVDDLIKSSGYRIGPFEIESVIMELPYVLECAVSPEPDEVRGQIVKASIVLTQGTEPSEQIKTEIQEYVKKHTAPYKYPRKVVFRDSLPKTISGKIMRNKL